MSESFSSNYRWFSANVAWAVLIINKIVNGLNKYVYHITINYMTCNIPPALNNRLAISLGGLISNITVGPGQGIFNMDLSKTSPNNRMISVNVALTVLKISETIYVLSQLL